MAEIGYCRLFLLLRNRPSEFVLVYGDINKLALSDFEGFPVLLCVDPHLDENANRASACFQYVAITADDGANVDRC